MKFLHVRESLLGAKFLGLGAAGKRIHADMHLAELAAAAGLLLMAITALGGGLNRLTKRNLGWLGIDVELVAAVQPLADDLQVQLAHARRDELLRLRIAVEAERR